MSAQKGQSGSGHTSPPESGGGGNRPLRVETANMYAERVAAEGLSPAELAAIEADAHRVYESVAERARGGLDAEFACLNLHGAMPAFLPDIEEAAAEVRRFAHVLVLGIGGSSLGAKAVHAALAEVVPANGAPQIYFLENIDPVFLRHLLARIEPADTTVICISKSGGTIETISQFLIVREWLAKRLGKDRADRHQWLITDPKSGWLRSLAEREGLHSLPVPPNVGGRYSVLTAVGLLPLAAAGVDIHALLQGAADNATRCATGEVAANPALEMACLSYLLDTRRDKRISIIMPYINALQLFGDWYRQLWAESLGKPRSDMPPAGTLPVPALGAVDQHSQLQMYLESRHDKMFTFITLDSWHDDLSIPLSGIDREAFPYIIGKTLGDVLNAEYLATRDVITRAGHPNTTIHLPALDAYGLGQLIDLYQRATVYTGLLYGINPLDQPAVEEGKRLAREYLSGGPSRS